jgi:hypothetical protein
MQPYQLQLIKMKLHCCQNYHSHFVFKQCNSTFIRKTKLRAPWPKPTLLTILRSPVLLWSYYKERRDSSVGIATGCATEGSEFESRQYEEFSLIRVVQSQPPIQWQPGFFFVVKGAKREADHSPQSSAEVKKTWNYIFTHPYVFSA